MKTDFWLTIKSKKSRYGTAKFECAGTPRANKTKPATGPDEISIKLNLEIPDSFFEQPQLTVSLKVPEPSGAATVTAKMQNGIANLISKELGVKVHISVPEAELQ